MNGGGYGDAAQTGDAPSPGGRDLGNESVSVTPIENAGDLRTLPARIGDCFQMGGVLQLVSDVGIVRSQRCSHSYHFSDEVRMTESPFDSLIQWASLLSINLRNRG